MGTFYPGISVSNFWTPENSVYHPWDFIIRSATEKLKMVQIAYDLENNHTGRMRLTIAIRLGF